MSIDALLRQEKTKLLNLGCRGRPNQIAKETVAFAGAEGGVILFGVTGDGGISGLPMYNLFKELCAYGIGR